MNCMRLSLPHTCSRRSGCAAIGIEQTAKVQAGEQLISHISPKTSEIWGTHSCGWVRVLRPVHSCLNLSPASRLQKCHPGEGMVRLRYNPPPGHVFLKKVR